AVDQVLVLGADRHEVDVARRQTMHLDLFLYGLPRDAKGHFLPNEALVGDRADNFSVLDESRSAADMVANPQNQHLLTHRSFTADRRRPSRPRRSRRETRLRRGWFLKAGRCAQNG